MPKITYTPKRFGRKALEVIHQAERIMTEYSRMGYDLTLRQLYYQFISRDLFPEDWTDLKTGSKNSERSYKRLGVIINDARLAGILDWNHLIDRTRPVNKLTTWGSPEDIIQAAAKGFRLDPWKDQPIYCECWVEKDALLGVVQNVADRWRIPYLACRGYYSQSAQWNAAMRVLRKKEYEGKNVVIFHLGDHDPSGLDMTRDNDERLRLMSGCDLDVRRLALNMDQIKMYSPPPNPTKMSDSRANNYFDQFGEECWELDALEPKVIDDLVHVAIGDIIDLTTWNNSLKREVSQRKELESAHSRWSEVVEFLADSN